MQNDDKNKAFFEQFVSSERYSTLISKIALIEPVQSSDEYLSPDGFDESVFYPRIMLNCVRRLVTVANDMEQIRPQKDALKIPYFITCIETLEKIKSPNGRSSKADIIKKFFVSYIDKSDFSSLVNGIKFKELSQSHKSENNKDKEFFYYLELFKSSPAQFISSFLSEIRNSAVHQAEAWNFCFSDGVFAHTQTVQIRGLSINKKNADMYYRIKQAGYIDCEFEISLSYASFTRIMTRAFFNFIERYVESLINSNSKLKG